jgi:Cu/Ag efflux protein CusF
MRLARIILAASMLTAVGSVAHAQEAQTGTVTTIDRISGTITVEQPQGGTVGGANTGGVAQQFKAQGIQLDKIHAGDKIKFTVGEAGGKKTITKIEQQ